MALPQRREVVRQFWTLIRAGCRPKAAAAALGFSPGVGKRWFGQAGGVAPPNVPAQSSGRYLSIQEREEISAGVEGDLTLREIGRRIGRPPSTVSRELRRNMRHQYRTSARLKNSAMGRPRLLPWDYRPSVAHKRADLRAARPKPAKLASNQRLHDEVQARLTERLSPQQISAELVQDFPDDLEMRVSHETIYQAIYVQGRGALRRELAVCLRTGRALRKPRRKGQERRGRIPDMVNISQRPAEVEDRAVPGHWEGDLIIGKYGRSAIGTLVERTTRYVMLLHLPLSHGALAVENAIIAATKTLPDVLLKSLTWDQGQEMTNHLQITIATGLQVYFCDPASPWQRGSNENTNGLLRQYFPKGTDLSVHPLDHLAFVAAQMNRRPRKTLGWNSPTKALTRLLSNHPNPASVASTG